MKVIKQKAIEARLREVPIVNIEFIDPQKEQCSTGYWIRSVCLEAADLIEVLQKEVTKLRAENQEMKNLGIQGINNLINK